MSDRYRLACGLLNTFVRSGRRGDTLEKPEPLVSDRVFLTRQRSLAFLLTAIALCMCIYGGLLAGKRHLSTERHHPVLVVAPESLRVGRVDATPDLPWMLKVTNVSQRTVRVVDIKTSCGCSQIEPSSFQIQPGESRSVQMHIKLVVTRAVGATGLESPMEIRIVPIIEGSNLPPAYWTLTATVIAPCLLDSDRVVFAGTDALIEGQSVTPKTIRGALSEDDLTVTPKPEHDGDIVDVKYLDGGRQIELSVQPAADRPQGWFSSAVELQLANRTGVSRGQLRLQVEGEVLPPVLFYPRSFMLGTLPLGKSVRERIFVDCTHGALLDASPQSEGINVAIEASSERHSSVTVDFVVRSLGPQQSSITLVYQSNDGKISTPEIPLCLTGIPSETEIAIEKNR